MKAEELKALKEKWEQGTVARVIQRYPERKPEFATQSGISIDRALTPLELEGWDYSQNRFQGQYRYPRGSAYHVPRAFLDNASVQVSARPKRRTGGSGSCSTRQTGLSVAFDLPTQVVTIPISLAEGEVGRLVAIDSLMDMETVFSGIPLDKSRHP